MLEHLDIWDTSIFLFLNGKHNAFWDFVMYWVSNKFFWIPLYLLFIFWLIKFYKKEAVWLLLAVIVLITLTDQMAFHLFKNTFERLRPCHNPDLVGLVHLVKGHCGGQYGFISNHASNHFALAVFLSYFPGEKFRYFTPVIFLWATIIAYSRIYLGVHYPGDVIAGAIFGSLMGLLIVKTYIITKKKLSIPGPSNRY